MNRLMVVGGGGFGHEVMAWAADCHAAGTLPPLSGYLDDVERGALGGRLQRIGSVADYSPQAGDELLIAVGAPRTKRQIVDLLRSRGARFAKLIHPSAIIGSNCQHDEGVIICPLAMNTANTHMASFSTLLSFSGLGHDARLGAFSIVSSHVDIMGHATVGEGVFIGSGARVMPGVKVGDDARIGANVVVQRNVSAGLTLFAAPAKSLKMPSSDK
ncbi:DapH/DapD/GlmU-related protein [Sphingobium boeckii]|uniref:Sugar O-acyltransferase (Sialic acid O-acetyltransferase NeuD family) n=1 Tax=Sphingobium boeckii TaxID=1082345 RepID=A0A7W9AHE5_9SPHN|nr:DapH/DapD/GlmU-related protein [Sphingobium boeckii]MBB5685735.1 sugar O-acyltransferase (sialic acid O-acetyltransferase NeuD family) [Sphingobium boeckii]